MIVHAAESLYLFNTTEPPYLIKGLPISLESRHTTVPGNISSGNIGTGEHRSRGTLC